MSQYSDGNGRLIISAGALNATVARNHPLPAPVNPPFRAIPTSDAILLERLEVLYRKLDDEGHYVSANTVALAIDRITMMPKETDA